MIQKEERPALFLDRDGIINIDTGFVRTIEEFEFRPTIFEICKLFKDKGYLIVVITNQSGIGRGIFPVEAFHILNNWMMKEFENRGLSIDLVLASALDPNNASATAREWSFRKPQPGMINAASEMLSIDLSHSVLIGDNDSDIEAGRRAGIKMNFQVNQELTRDNSYVYSTLEECLVRLRNIIK